MQEIQRRIGENIRTLRKRKGLTQDALADICGLHRAHLGEVERGECNVTIQTLKLLADAFGVRISDLLNGL